jgi:cysteine synthase
MEAETRRRALAAAASSPLDPVNLFNITWRRPDDSMSCFVAPKQLTGIDANVIALYSKDFPTGSHKVGATYSVTMENQLRGAIRPGQHKIVFPSTGNYGIGGAWAGARMGYDTLVVLPELMSRERFEKITSYGARYYTTPGGESSVKEIYDKCRQLSLDPAVRVLNQFEEMPNYRFHYHCTGNIVVEAVRELKQTGTGDGRCAAFVSAMGSAGTIAAGDRIKQEFPETKIVGLEPIQCPTLYCNGFGEHDIQGIGDKHVTWIHNVMNMDALACVDDMQCKLMLQVLTGPAGLEYLSCDLGIEQSLVKMISECFGISGVCNLIGAIKIARHFRLGPGDNVVTVLTDSIDRYNSVMRALDDQFGRLDRREAQSRHERILLGAGLDHIQEGTRLNRERWHNLKYFTWVEQHGKRVEDLSAQRSQAWWRDHQAMVPEIDRSLRKARG